MPELAFDADEHRGICDAPCGIRMSMNDLTLPVVARPVSRISPEERARRQAADDYARASIRLEGFEPSAYSDEMTRRYIAGEITRAELTAAILAHHDP